MDERHRHRYEVNPTYIEAFETAGMKFVGRSEDNQRMEILELQGKYAHVHFNQCETFSYRSSLLRWCSISSGIHFTSSQTISTVSRLDLGLFFFFLYSVANQLTLLLLLSSRLRVAN